MSNPNVQALTLDYHTRQFFDPAGWTGAVEARFFLNVAGLEEREFQGRMARFCTGQVFIILQDVEKRACFVSHLPFFVSTEPWCPEDVAGHRARAESRRWALSARCSPCFSKPNLNPRKPLMQPNHRHNLSIREGTSDDAEWFFAVEEQTTWENLPTDCASMSRDELRDKLRATHGLLLSCPGNVFFIACDDTTSEKLGLLWFGPRHNPISGEHEGWIYNVTTLPAHRGCGVSKTLMAHAERYAGEQGYRVIGLSVATHNEAALSLYQSLEFRQSNILMRKPVARAT